MYYQYAEKLTCEGSKKKRFTIARLCLRIIGLIKNSIVFIKCLLNILIMSLLSRSSCTECNDTFTKSIDIH